jgi:hypothetical protein
MWNKVMGFNSFVLWPIALIFLIYSAGRAAILFDWRTFVVALVIFIILTIVQMVLAIMSD